MPAMLSCRRNGRKASRAWPFRVMRLWGALGARPEFDPLATDAVTEQPRQAVRKRKRLAKRMGAGAGNSPPGGAPAGDRRLPHARSAGRPASGGWATRGATEPARARPRPAARRRAGRGRAGWRRRPHPGWQVDADAATGDIACAASPISSRPGRCQRRGRSTRTSSNLTSSRSAVPACARRRTAATARPGRGTPAAAARATRRRCRLRDQVGALPVVVAVQHHQHARARARRCGPRRSPRGQPEPQRIHRCAERVDSSPAASRKVEFRPSQPTTRSASISSGPSASSAHAAHASSASNSSPVTRVLSAGRTCPAHGRRRPHVEKSHCGTSAVVEGPQPGEIAERQFAFGEADVQQGFAALRQPVEDIAQSDLRKHVQRQGCTVSPRKSRRKSRASPAPALARRARQQQAEHHPGQARRRRCSNACAGGGRGHARLSSAGPNRPPSATTRRCRLRRYGRSQTLRAELLSRRPLRPRVAQERGRCPSAAIATAARRRRRTRGTRG